MPLTAAMLDEQDRLALLLIFRSMIPLAGEDGIRMALSATCRVLREVRLDWKRKSVVAAIKAD